MESIIEVRQIEIDRGLQDVCNSPMALAIRRHLVKGDYAYVSWDTVRFSSLNHSFSMMLPAIAAKWNQDHATGKPVRPITFPLAIPEIYVNETFRHFKPE